MTRRSPGLPLMFLLVLAGVFALVGYYALLTHLALAGWARRLLAVHFTGLPGDPGEALSIWAHNSKVVAGVAACVMLTRLARALARTPTRAPLLADVLLAGWALALTVAAGVLLGAYGARQARAWSPFAPVEAAGWALLLALYIESRRGRVSLRGVLCGLALVEVLLAIAAVLEVAG